MSLRRLLSVLGLALLCAAAPLAALAVEPLPAEQKAVFWGSPEDAPAKKLLGISEQFEGRHYLTGDEFHPHLWYPHVKDLDGGYVGVGSDQAYLYVGWTRPRFAWLIDYDPLVVDLHGVYRAFFLEAETPEAFLKLWAAGQQSVAQDRLAHHYADHPKLKTYQELYRRNRGNIHYRLTLVRKQMQKQKTPSWISDAGTYTFVRDLYKAGRIRPLSTDLLADKGMKGIGDAARNLGVTIRVLYLSNAEEYWPYSQQYRDNVRGLPMDDKSRVIRTLSSFSVNKDYRYNVQPGLLYQAWLERKTLKGVRQMVKRRKLEGPDDVEITVTDSDPAAIEAKKAEKASKKKRK